MRVVLDPGLAIPEDSHVLDGAAPTLLLHAPDARVPAYLRERERAAIPAHEDGMLDLDAALRLLATRGVNEVQTEAGATLCGGLLQAGLVDELLLYVVPILLGARGKPLFGGWDAPTMIERYDLQLVETPRRWGPTCACCCSPRRAQRRHEARMFTGLIQAVGRIESQQTRGGDMRLRVDAGGLPMHDVAMGESIAVSGVCLTVVELDARGFAADVSNETLARTTLGALAVGAAVNLERALLATDRLGGHLVAGHVDGVGTVLSIVDDARSQRWRFSAPSALLRYIAEKGSICVDGVSLTVNAVDAEGFEVNLIPHTIAHTAFGEAHVGTAVNLEADLVARYVERLYSCDRP